MEQNSRTSFKKLIRPRNLSLLGVVLIILALYSIRPETNITLAVTVVVLVNAGFSLVLISLIWGIALSGNAKERSLANKWVCTVGAAICLLATGALSGFTAQVTDIGALYVLMFVWPTMLVLFIIGLLALRFLQWKWLFKLAVIVVSLIGGFFIGDYLQQIFIAPLQG